MVQHQPQQVLAVVEDVGSGGSVMLGGAGSSFTKLTTALNNNQGAFTLKNDRALTTAGAYTNSGITRVEDSTTTLTVNGAYTQTAGSTIITGGAVIAGTAFNLDGGELKGTGTIQSSVIAGPGSNTIAPGLSPGALTISGDLTLSSGSTLSMEIGGLSQGSLYDFLDVNGTLTLAGMLDLNFINDFQNSVTALDTFTLATANTDITGSFLNIASGNRFVMGTFGSFEVWYGTGSAFGANNLVLSSFGAVPEPSRALLVMLGFFGLAARRRRCAS